MIIYVNFIVIILVIFSLFQIQIMFSFMIVVVGKVISGTLMNMSVNPLSFYNFL